MDKFNELRNKYKKFIYHSYKITENNEYILIEYNFEIENLKTFNPSIKILKSDINFKNVESSFVKNMIFNIGMVESISYWKSSCPKDIIIQCGYLDAEQIVWFKKLYYYGLGEYRFINNIKIEKDDFVNIICNYKKQENIEPLENIYNLSGTIIPVGGGKDSCVTLELLKDNKENNLCLLIGGKEPSIKTVEIAGYNKNQIIEVSRIIDKNLIELNKQGFLNGHTPFSALLAFLSYLIAFLTNKKYVALSNESSANESNVEGDKINHQYSKSFEFEQDFRNYSNKYLNAKVEYFSMLRPLNELQIAMLFSKLDKYHKIFRSCNVGSKIVPWEWCGGCPKCLFVFVILSQFLYKEKLVEIFKNDLFDKKELLKTFIELCGYGKTKPFECVGTYEEVNYAISKTINNLESKNEKLPYLLQYYKDNYKMIDTKTEEILKRFNEENNLTEEFDKILRGKIND